MIDTWLIFGQLIPWIEVLLHTIIETLRFDEGLGRNINHHGKTITVGEEETKMSADTGENYRNISIPSIINVTEMTERDDEKLMEERQDDSTSGNEKMEMLKIMDFIGENQEC